MSETAAGNDQFTAFWNDVLAAKFERFRNILLDGLSYHSAVPLRTLALAQGASALDVGCGWGDTAIHLAHIVGPRGAVLGIDCCDSFLAKGRRDAAEAGLRNVRFVAADVQAYPFKPEFDFCFSRFGMMFFSNPVAALRNVSAALKPGGRLMFVTWRAIEHNPWLGVPKAVTLAFLPPPSEDADTCGPGPFSMANTEVVTRQLEAAGFEDIAFQATDGPVMIGSSVEQAVEFQLALGPAGEIFREAGDQALHRRPEIERALRTELARHRRPNGEVAMQSSSWTITAAKPSA